MKADYIKSLKKELSVFGTIKIFKKGKWVIINENIQ